MSLARNAACACGSGKRRKDCCGRLSTPPQAGGPGPMDGLLELLRQGDFAQLERCAARELERHADDGRLWQLLTLALQRQERPALLAASQAARTMPNDAVAQLAWANELARAGQLAHACDAYAGALVLRGDFAEAHANLGQALCELQQFEESVARCERALAINPRLSQAHYTAARATLAVHRVDEALWHFRQALRIDPALLEARVEMACTLRRIGRLTEAEADLRQALRHDPDLAAAHLELAIVCRLGRRGEECEFHCGRVLQIEPESAEALAVRAELLADQGDFAQAELLHRRALASAPERIESIAALAQLRRLSIADGPWAREVQRLLERPWPARRRRLLHFALGKYFDDTLDFDAAFAHYQRANELSSECAPGHDTAALERTVDTLIRSQDRAWLAASRSGEGSERPVFIVGMLRSGTTLAEQILASHPDMFGAGELNFWSTHCAEAVAAAATAHGALPFDRTEAARLGTAYLAHLAGLCRDAARVVDKFPANFFFLGLIHAAFPKARIIHLQRDPRDTCLSIYFQQFEAANTYAGNLEHLAHYHRHYARLMAHWRVTLPREVLLEVPYEQLVADPERWSRAMVDFAGLPWHPRCLEFHRTPRTVVTASRWQVRQGILTSSVGRWRHYEKHLGPLLGLGGKQLPPV